MATRKKAPAARPPAGPTPSAAPAAGTPASPLAQSNPHDKPFTPQVLDRSPIAIPLLEALKAEDEALKANPATPRRTYHVIIDLHLEFPGGRGAARKRVPQLLAAIFRDHGDWTQPRGAGSGLKDSPSEQYLFGELEGRVIRELIRRDRGEADARSRAKGRASSAAIFRIWPDFAVKALLYKSVSTIKADAALNSFSTTGEKIVWAVMDSGIDALHPHFATWANLDVSGLSLRHRDLTAPADQNPDENELNALVDRYGHGTHVAGIIAGSRTAEQGEIVAHTRFRDEAGEVKEQDDLPPRISGIAPRCKLLSLKVLDDEGNGRASSLICAIAEIQRINGNGRFIRVHGVNMSVGYDFEPEWFACGQSPLCVEVNRLVKSGVVVVVAAGNTGYGFAQSAARGTVAAGLGLTINDPGNADLALTVGSTHRDSPHVYGVSYFSSKGPTGDGRAKPDLVAPGEKIVSCATGWSAQSDPARLDRLRRQVAQWGQPAAGTAAKKPAKAAAQYKEDSGTSMAAPHVSGAIAAFLSVRREYIGEPEKVKEVFVSTATDLRRDRYFQGTGLLDLMRAIQSV
jgi:serine protease AprX